MTICPLTGRVFSRNNQCWMNIPHGILVLLLDLFFPMSRDAIWGGETYIKIWTREYGYFVGLRVVGVLVFASRVRAVSGVR